MFMEDWKLYSLFFKYTPFILTVWMHGFGALRTLNVDPALLQLDLDVALEALETGQVVTIAEEGELINGHADEAQGALTDLKKGTNQMRKSINTNLEGRKIYLWQHNRIQ